MIVAAAQIAPVLLDREATLERIESAARESAAAGARLIAFPETILPGYPTWIAKTGGAQFDDPIQKELHGRYLDQAVELPGPVLTRLQSLAGDTQQSLVIGVAERGIETGRGTLYATALVVHPDGNWTAHRKLVPTYEERLAWGWGDGHGLVVHTIDGWRVSVLNCWENWMPAARLALYAQGTELHISLWPGSPSLTEDISRFTAREGRVYVLAASGVMGPSDVPLDLPGGAEFRKTLLDNAPAAGLHSGGSRLIRPDGSEQDALVTNEPGLLIQSLDRSRVLAERQNFDAAGHYHRPDVFHFEVDRGRRQAATFQD